METEDPIAQGPLAGLILADQESGSSARDLPASVLPFLGQTVVEYQAHLLRHCGAQHIVVLAGQLPADLVRAFDRLRLEGINLDIARDARDAADRIHPDERLMVFSAGAVTSAPVAQSLLHNGGPTLLVVENSAENEGFELIDAQHRWTGIALLNGTLLRETLKILGDWSLGSTLLRVAVQHGAHKQACARGDMARLATQDEAEIQSRAFVAHAASASGGRLAAPVALFASQMARWRVPVDLLAVLPLVLLGVAILLAATGWTATGAMSLIAARLPALAAGALTGAMLQHRKLLDWFDRLRMPAALVLAAIVAAALVRGGHDWAVALGAAWLGWLLLVERQEVRPAWARVTPEWLALVLGVGALAGQAHWAIGALLAQAILGRISAIFGVKRFNRP